MEWNTIIEWALGIVSSALLSGITYLFNKYKKVKKKYLDFIQDFSFFLGVSYGAKDIAPQELKDIIEYLNIKYGKDFKNELIKKDMNKHKELSVEQKGN